MFEKTRLKNIIPAFICFVCIFVSGGIVSAENHTVKQIESGKQIHNQYLRFEQLKYLRHTTTDIYYSDYTKPGYEYKLAIDSTKILAPEKDFEKYGRAIFSNKYSFHPDYVGLGEYIATIQTLSRKNRSIQASPAAFSLAQSYEPLGLGQFDIDHRYKEVSGENLGINGSILGIDNDYIYFTDSSSKDNYGYRFYRIKKDGSEKDIGGTKIIDTRYTEYMSMDNEYIYYRNRNNEHKLYRTKKDGSEITTGGTKIIDIPYSSSIFIDGEYIYYNNRYDEYKLYRTKKDGGEINTGGIKVIDVPYSYVYTGFLDLEYIYYKNSSDENKLYRAKKDGSEIEIGGKKIINTTNTSRIHISGDYIYYANSNDENKLYRAKKDGSESGVWGTKILNADIGFPYFDETYMYYINSNDNKSIYRVRKDGSESGVWGTKILDIENVSNFKLDVNYIYYRYGNEIYKINKDGTGDFSQTDGTYTSQQINLRDGLNFLKINTQEIIPEGTSYKMYLSDGEYESPQASNSIFKQAYAEGYSFEDSFKELPVEYINTDKALNIHTFFGSQSTEKIFFKIELIGDPDDTSKTPVIESVSIVEADGIELPVIAETIQYLKKSGEIPRFEMPVSRAVGKNQSASGITLSTTINNTNGNEYIIKTVINNIETTNLSYSISTPSFTGSIGTTTYLNMPVGKYSWKSRIEDVDGNLGEWKEFGSNNSDEVDFSVFGGFEPYGDGYSFENSSAKSQLLTGGTTWHWKGIADVSGFYPTRVKVDGRKWDIFNNTFPDSEFSSEKEKIAIFEALGLNDENPNIFSIGSCHGLSLTATTQDIYPGILEQTAPEFSSQVGSGSVFDRIKFAPDNNGYWKEYDKTLETVLSAQLSQNYQHYVDAKIYSREKETKQEMMNKIIDFPEKRYILSLEVAKDKDASLQGHAVVPYRVEGNRIYIWDNMVPFPGIIKENKITKEDEYFDAYNQYIEILSDGTFKNEFYQKTLGFQYFTNLAIVDIDDIYLLDHKGIIGFNDTDTLYSLSGEADLLVKDNQGRLSGFSGNKIFKEIPGVEIINQLGISFNSDSTNNFKQIYLPNKQDLEIEVIGNNDENYDLMIAGGDYYNKISNVETSSGQIDRFEILREEIKIDLDDDKIGNYDITIDDFQSNGSGSVFIANITSIAEPQKYAVNWEKVANNTDSPIQYQVDVDSDGSYDTMIELPAVTHDLVAPTTNVSFSGTLLETVNTYIEKLDIKLESTDDYSGVGSIYYSLTDLDDFIKYSTGFTIKDTGDYTLRYYGTDRAGNNEEINEISFAIVQEESTETGKIYGYMYNDRNKNEKKNNWENTKKKWKVYIDLNNDGKHQKKTEPFIKTKKNGYYEFTNLKNGTYIIRVIKKGKNYKIRTPKKKYYKVRLTEKKNVKKRNFGIRKYK